MNLKEKWKRFWTLDVHNHEGFTLVELIIVIAILAILSTGAIAGYSVYVERANKAADDALISEINMAFRAACLENYLDVFDIKDADIAVTDGVIGAVSNVKVNGDTNGSIGAKIAADFPTYFSATNAKLKYYRELDFNNTLHQFVPKETNFDEETMDEMRVALNGIAAYFSTMVKIGMTGDALQEFLTDNVSNELAEALGLNGMVNGLNAAMKMSDEELKAYLLANVEGYADMGPDVQEALKATVRGNLGVLHFAEDAATRTVEEVKQSVENFRSTMMAALTNSGSVTFEQLEAYFLSLDDTDVEWYNALSSSEKVIEVNKFRDDPAAISLGDLKLSGAQVTAMSLAVNQTGGNSAGISMLGSLYALSAGFFNSTYYQGAKEDIPPYTDFACVMAAMADSNFDAYYAAMGEADLEAYLGYMGGLSQSDINLADPNAFSSN